MKLRDYQEEAVESVIQYFMMGNTGNPVIAMPTGTGKSLVIAGLIKRIMQNWSGQRLMVLTHVKELIEQNADKMSKLWPQAPLGIYSAGLRQRDTLMPIIFGGAASVINCIEQFGYRDLLIIDECHLLSPEEDTTYQKLIAALKILNPNLKVIGLSATAFRMGQGMITDGGLFTDICCDMTGIAPFARFIAEGYLVPLYPRKTKVELDVSNVGMTKGDFSKKQLQDAVNKREITYQALMQVCEDGADRKAWLVFASGVEHAEDIAAMLREFGITAEAVHSKMSGKERDRRIKEFKSGLIRCLVNNGVLTTGFDHPPLDLIVMLRPTMSPGLWVQMLGRGTRPSPETGKTDCLVLDFAGNTRRLGPINDPKIPKKKGAGGGDAPVKICEHCGTYNHISVRHCDFCGEEFEFQVKIVASSAGEDLIRSDLPVIEYFNVNQVAYYLHTKDSAKTADNNLAKVSSKPMIRVTYMCSDGMHRFDEYVCLEHVGFPGKKARDWWRQRFPGDYVPETTAEGLQHIQQLRVPRQIKVWLNKKYPEVLGYEY